MATIRYHPDVADRAALVQAIEAAGYDIRRRPVGVLAKSSSPRSLPLADGFAADDRARARESRALLIEAAVSIVTALAIMAVMFAPQTVIGLVELNRIVLIPATIVQAWAGRRFYRAAWRAARHGTTNMDTLVAVGTSAAWGYSAVVALWPAVFVAAGMKPETYFDSSTHHHRSRPARALARGAGQGPDDRRDPPPARAQPGNGERRQRWSRRLGRTAGRWRRSPSGRCCASGRANACPWTASSWTADPPVDASMLTGEPIPVVVAPGDEVIGATLNTTGTFVMRATRVGRDTALARIVELVESGPGLQGTDPAARRPDRRDLRADRPDRRVGHVRTLDRRRSGPAHHVRADRVRQRARHRLPVRDGSCHADGHHGRHRPWRRGRHPASAAARRSRRRTVSTAVVMDKTGTLTLGRPVVEAVVPAAGWSVARGARRGGRPRKGERASAWGRDPRSCARRTSSVSGT